MWWFLRWMCTISKDNVIMHDEFCNVFNFKYLDGNDVNFDLIAANMSTNDIKVSINKSKKIMLNVSKKCKNVLKSYKKAMNEMFPGNNDEIAS